MDAEAVRRARNFLSNVCIGLWKGHEIKRLNSLGPELFPVFRAIIETEEDPTRRKELVLVQRQILVDLNGLIGQKIIESRIKAKDIEEFLIWLGQLQYEN